MSFSKSFALAINNVLNSKMRSFLTMLGIIIGVASVIILVSLMGGLTGQITDIFADMGTNTINISVQERSTRSVDVEEIYALRDENPDLIGEVSPTVSFRGIIKLGTKSITTGVTGVSEELEVARNLTVEQGNFIRYIQVERMQNVCVIGTYIEKEFFKDISALGQTIKINGYPYQIIGVLEEGAESDKNSADDVIYIPYTNATKILKNSAVNSYTVTNKDESRLEETMQLINDKLNKIIGDSDYYNVQSMKQLLEQFDTIMGSMTTVLVCIAGISLLVGGIGIMNIMLVSVTERTREIGIRKSLGAKRKDIMRQFVIEAATVSSVGGIIGIILGAIMARLFGNLLELTVVPSVGAILLAFGVSVGIGVAFGFLPAGKASKLNPIDALRYD